LTVLSSDITWWEWWNDQNDIVVQVEESGTAIREFDIDNVTEYVKTKLKFHIWVRDFHTHSINPPTGDWEDDIPLAPPSDSLTQPLRMMELVAYFKDLVNNNPNALMLPSPYSGPIIQMELTDDYEVVSNDWEHEVFHWILLVDLTYIEN
jgi:hypothetical protein